MNNLVGRTVSHHRILDQVGQGGMGIVYKAEDTSDPAFSGIELSVIDHPRLPKRIARGGQASWSTRGGQAWITDSLKRNCS